jgi:dethiobiotin synthetase
MALVVVTGTGTGIGKTHFAEALLRALGEQGKRAVGLKPVETGLRDTTVSDATRLAAASSFHVKHAGLRFDDPVSPHVAAREAGRPISVHALAAEIQSVRPQVDITVVELAGGLFTPLTDELMNADLALAVRADLLLLVAPDRLGVLHDLVAATRAAHATALPVHGIVLMEPEHPDTSTGRNAPEVERLLRIPLLGSLPRALAADLASHPAVQHAAKLALAVRARTP